MTLILAIDLATRTGFARGRVGELPVAGSIHFAKQNSRTIPQSSPMRCAGYRKNSSRSPGRTL